jgi:hypothetical protein
MNMLLEDSPMNRTRNRIILKLALIALSFFALLLLVSCPPVKLLQPQDPLPGQVDVLYLHHSTGGVIWGGGVQNALGTYATSHQKDYSIIDQEFPKSSPYGWANYPYDYWNIWVNHAGTAEYMTEPTLEMLTQTYEVIVLKHCYPVSDIGPDSASASVSSASEQLQNYYLQYNALKAKMRTFPNTRFIVWTGAARAVGATPPENAARSRTFFTWVKNTWDESGDNIYVWDFFELETEGGNYLLPAYADDTEGHPNGTFAATVAPYFVNRLVDVIEGRGDTGSLTGQP